MPTPSQPQAHLTRDLAAADSGDALTAAQIVWRATIARERRRFKLVAPVALLLAGALLGLGIATLTPWWAAASLILIGLAVVAATVGRYLLMTRRHQRLSVPEARAVEALLAADTSVAVVIPAFNAEAVIGTAIECLQRQSYPQWRAIIVDDGSTDGTAAAVQAKAADDSRVTLVRLAANSGASVARNAGLAVAGEDFVVYLDADDVLLGDALRNRLIATVRVPLATGAFGRQDQVGSVAGWQQRQADRRPKTPENINISTAGGDQPFGAPAAVLMRRAACRDLAGFDEAMPSSMDFDYWMRSLRSGHEYQYCGYMDSLYAQLPGSIVGKSLEQHGRRFMHILDDHWAGVRLGFRASTGSDREGPLGDVLRAGIAQLRYLRIVGMLIGMGQDPSTAVRSTADFAPAKAPLPPDYAIRAVAYGIKREYRRAGQRDGQQLADKALRLARESAADIVTIPEVDLLAPDPHPSWAVVVTSPAQARAVAASLREVPTGDWPIIVSTECWLGDAGALQVLRDLDQQIQTVSLPGFFLQGVRYRRIVVCSSDPWLLDTLAALTTDRGSDLVRLDGESAWPGIAAHAGPAGTVARVRVEGTLDASPLARVT